MKISKLSTINKRKAISTLTAICFCIFFLINNLFARNGYGERDDGFSTVIIIGIAVIVILLIIRKKSRKNSEASLSNEQNGAKNKKITTNPNLIQDNDVTTKMVYDKLRLFKVQINEKIQFGFTEHIIHKQMEKHFKNIFQNVTMENNVGGKSGLAIDLDIGNGKVGIEVKLAHKIFKSSEKNRLYGQMNQYRTFKYKDENLIIAVVGYDDEFRNSIISDVEDYVNSHRAVFWFVNVGERTLPDEVPTSKEFGAL